MLDGFWPTMTLWIVLTGLPIGAFAVLLIVRGGTTIQPRHDIQWVGLHDLLTGPAMPAPTADVHPTPALAERQPVPVGPSGSEALTARRSVTPTGTTPAPALLETGGAAVAVEIEPDVVDDAPEPAVQDETLIEVLLRAHPQTGLSWTGYAGLLGVSRSTLTRWRDSGRVPAVHEPRIRHIAALVEDWDGEPADRSYRWGVRTDGRTLWERTRETLQAL